MALLFWALVFGAPIVALGFFIRFAYLRFVRKRQDVKESPSTSLAFNVAE
jgi:hypothetical protein